MGVKYGTTTALSSSLNPAQVGQPVIVIASVSSSNEGTPTGMVTFRSGGTVLGTAMLDSTGTATLSTSALSVGTHTITARYAGDDTFAPSRATPLRQVVAKYASTIMLTSSANPSPSGQAVTFTAQVSGGAGGTPTGTVTFRNGGALLGMVPLNGGTATITISTLTRGAHAISAAYGGDDSFTTSSDTLRQRVR